MVRQRLEETEPDSTETRGAFLARLRRTVRWLNLHKEQEALGSCRDQKQRARAVLALKGARTKW